MMLRILLLIPFLCSGAALAATAPAPCTAPEHRQFDFWLGEWVVTNAADGSPAGSNHIQTAQGACVLHEQWTSASNHRGESFNIYDAARGVWHQTWVDNSGLLLTIEGGFKGGAMVLEGERPGKDGGSAQHRITWTPRKDKTVRQHWEVSSDAGKTWTTAFDGIYTRK